MFFNPFFGRGFICLFVFFFLCFESVTGRLRVIEIVTGLLLTFAEGTTLSLKAVLAVAAGTQKGTIADQTDRERTAIVATVAARVRSRFAMRGNEYRFHIWGT